MEGDAILRTDGGVRGLVKRQMLDLSFRRRLLINFQETCTVDEYIKRREKVRTDYIPLMSLPAISPRAIFSIDVDAVLACN